MKFFCSKLFRHIAKMEEQEDVNTVLCNKFTRERLQVEE